MFKFKSKKKREAERRIAERNALTWYAPMSDAVTKDGNLVLTIEPSRGQVVATVIPLRNTIPMSDGFHSTGASKWSTPDWKASSRARNELLASVVRNPFHIHHTSKGIEFQFDKILFKKQLHHAKELVSDPKRTRALIHETRKQDKALEDSLLFL